jgi:hypothetical protein
MSGFPPRLYGDAAVSGAFAAMGFTAPVCVQIPILTAISPRYLAAMSSVNASDVTRLFPGIEDHTVVEVLASKPTLADLEAASQLLADQDEGMEDADSALRERVSGLVAILAAAGLTAPADDRR